MRTPPTRDTSCAMSRGSSTRTGAPTGTSCDANGALSSLPRATLLFSAARRAGAMPHWRDSSSHESPGTTTCILHGSSFMLTA